MGWDADAVRKKTAAPALLLVSVERLLQLVRGSGVFH